MEPLLAVWQGSQTLLFTGLMLIGGLWLAHMLIMRRACHGSTAPSPAYDAGDFEQVPGKNIFDNAALATVMARRRMARRR